MKKNYFIVNVNVYGKNGYSFMICTNMDSYDDIIEEAKNGNCFHNDYDARIADIDNLIGQCDIDHFKSVGAFFDFSFDTDAVHDVAYNTLATVLPLEYVIPLIDNILDDVINDIKETADKNFNDDDVRLAIGRVLVARTNK